MAKHSAGLRHDGFDENEPDCPTQVGSGGGSRSYFHHGTTLNQSLVSATVCVLRVSCGVRTFQRNSTYWKTYIKDEQSLPFVVKDDTGQAVVDSSKIKLVVEEDRFSRSGFMNDADSDLQQLLESRYNKKTKGWIFNKTLRYTERALELDEEVYVFGDASQLGDGWVLSDGEMPLIVSDKGGAPIEQSYSSKITWLKIGTAIAAAGGVAGLFILLI